MSMYDKNHYNKKKRKKFFSFPFKIDFVNIFLIMTVWSYVLGNGREPHSMLINSHKNPAGLTLLSRCKQPGPQSSAASGVNGGCGLLATPPVPMSSDLV